MYGERKREQLRETVRTKGKRGQRGMKRERGGDKGRRMVRTGKGNMNKVKL